MYMDEYKLRYIIQLRKYLLIYNWLCTFIPIIVEFCQLPFFFSKDNIFILFSPINILNYIHGFPLIELPLDSSKSTPLDHDEFLSVLGICLLVSDLCLALISCSFLWVQFWSYFYVNLYLFHCKNWGSFPSFSYAQKKYN